jgi:hypothetical protein
MRNFKKYRSILLLTIPLLILFQVQLTNASSLDVISEKEIYSVSEEDAYKVAEKFLITHDLEDKIDNLVSVEAVYDLNDQKIGYYFNLINSYVLVSASKEYSPVFAAGGGKLSLSQIDDNGKLYYLGGLSLIKATNSDQVLEIINLKFANKPVSKKQYNLQKNPNSKAAWSNYLNDSRLITPLSILTEKKLSVDIFNQYDSNVNSLYRNSACGPTTMAAITEYWRTVKGKSLLDGLNTYSSKGAMINHFYSNHGGSLLGMSVSTLRSGLENHAGHGNAYSTATASVISGYNSYKTEINNGRPVAIKFDRWFTLFEPDNDYAYDYHWVVGKGYAYDVFDTMFIINNNVASTENGQTQYLDFPTNEPILTLVKFEI